VATASEEVERGRGEREHGGQEEELERPAAKHPAAEEDGPSVASGTSTVASRELRIVSEARPSWPSRGPSILSSSSPAGEDAASDAVVIRIDGTPRSRRGDAPRPRRGARATPAASAHPGAEAEPVSVAIRLIAVDTSAGGGERPSRPESSIRGRPGPASPWSETTATDRRASGDRDANRAAPRPPYAPPSVDRKTSVCSGVRADSVVPAVAYGRASSTSTAVPLALSFAPALLPLLSRWATKTIVSSRVPGTTAATFTSSTRPTPGTSCSHRSSRTGKP
jgi:hypothetical protein